MLNIIGEESLTYMLLCGNIPYLPLGLYMPSAPISRQKKSLTKPKKISLGSCGHRTQNTVITSVVEGKDIPDRFLKNPSKKYRLLLKSYGVVPRVKNSEE
jgi:hypothetical protein